MRRNRSYDNDVLNRLTQVDGPNPEYFVHDPAHNILAAANSKDEAKQQASATEIKGNRLAFRGDTHYRYDIHGNRIAELRGKGQKLQTRYHYNSRQQLVRVEKLKVEEGVEQLQQEIHYQYDPLGRRIGKAANNEKTDFLWDGDVLLREKKADIHTQQDLKTRTYYFEPGTFNPVALKEDEQFYHYHLDHLDHLDHLGTPDTLTNQEGEVVWSVAYKSYGNIALAHENQIEQPIRFQGQYFDEETGLHYNRFRYYDPQVGEFTQQDPIGLLGGVNNYQYALNPILWIDPYGLSNLKGVDFTGSSDLFPIAEDGQSNIVKIQLQGNRYGDFKQANIAGGFGKTGKSHPEGYTWHHLDDYDPVTNTSTMQLVSRDAHEATYPHMGSVKQFQDAHGVKYETKEARALAKELNGAALSEVTTSCKKEKF
ncbi:HNH endonuclease [Microbulbifer sp. OS29]|uniref:HNH endonuclease n=1 Tax=Microbulbifer okhotskensis TaxID=2926617 RepID=A0A9X2EMM0_9GAMM|nr:RHS repeat-associated core domain-containing protein [Microbulbifer okhotskensis]MCO1333890.1 HNH endonuclease [Microbulbifer okhotskensis]